MNASLIILEIPIYRKSPAAYSTETERLRSRAIDPEAIYADWGQDFGKRFWAFLSPLQREQITRQWLAYFDTSPENLPWPFNDIIGYLVLTSRDGRIAAEYWRVNAKRLVRQPATRTSAHGNSIRAASSS